MGNVARMRMPLLAAWMLAAALFQKGALAAETSIPDVIDIWSCRYLLRGMPVIGHGDPDYYRGAPAHGEGPSSLFGRDMTTLKLDDALVTRDDAAHKSHGTKIDPAIVAAETKAERERAAAAGLQKPQRNEMRTPAQIEAQYHDLVDQVRTARDTGRPMSIEKFLGLVGAKFDSGGLLRFDKVAGDKNFEGYEGLFAKFNIRNVRLVGDADFKAEDLQAGVLVRWGAKFKDGVVDFATGTAELLRLKDKSPKRQEPDHEIIISVPNLPENDPIAGMLWIKSLYLGLHEAATQFIHADLAKRPLKDANKMWTYYWKDELRRLDSATGRALDEIDNYVKRVQQRETLEAFRPDFPDMQARDLPLNGFSGIAPDLPPTALGSPLLYSVRNYGKTLSPYPIVGPIVALPTAILNIGAKDPLVEYKPSQLWLRGSDAINPATGQRYMPKEGLAIEEAKHEERVADAFKFKARLATSIKIAATVAAFSVGGHFMNQQQQKSMVNTVQQEIVDDSKNADKINKLTAEQLQKLPYVELEKKLEEYKQWVKEAAQHAQAANQKKNYTLAAKYVAQQEECEAQVEEILKRIKSFSPEGIEGL